MLLPKYCEKINCIVDLSGHGMHGIRILYFNKMVEFLTTHYSGLLNKMFIYDFSKDFEKTWSTLLKVIPQKTAEKIQLVTKDEGRKTISKEFGKKSVEEKFGGEVKGIIGSYWPPRPCRGEEKLTLENIQEKKLELFTINGEDFDLKLFPGPYKAHPFLTLMSRNFNTTVWIITILLISTVVAFALLKR